MAVVIEKTGKTVDEAYALALEELGVAKEATIMEVIEVPTKKLFGLLGSTPAKIRVTVIEEDRSEEVAAAVAASIVSTSSEETVLNEEVSVAVSVPVSNEEIEAPLSRAEKFLKGIFGYMNLEVDMKIEEKEGITKINLYGETLGILIGKHGQTLDSLQYLTNLAANKGITENKIRIIIDIENYRSRREETLCNLASRLAEKARRTGRKIMLEPMNRHERKIIHMALQNNPKVVTYSAGDEPYRKVVIEPKNKY